MRESIIGDARLILADCREVLPTLKNIDHVITDPPYSAKTHNGARTHGNLESPFIDFDAMSDTDFLAFCGQCVNLAQRWVVMTCAWQHAAKLEDSGLPLVRLGVWVKSNGAPQFSGDRPGVGWEAVAILHREGRKHWNGGGHHAVWECPIVTPGTSRHPTEKPVRLVSDWVRLFSDPGEMVLDPCFGSGTTGVACMKMGRRFIGVEKREDYFNIGVSRIQQAYSEPNLFAAHAAKQRQTRLFT
jgi:site-specific DNA-methyltransferase (adenine-specific)